MRKNLIFHYPFDTEIGNWFEKTMHNEATDIALSNEHVRRGTHSCKVTLRKGLNIRTEFGTNPTEATERAIFGCSILLPSYFEHSELVESVIAWQSFPNLDIGENFRNSPLFIALHNGNWVMDTRTDPALNSNGGATVLHKRYYTELGPATKGVWHDFVVEVWWSYHSGEGYIKVWKDNKLVITHLGPNCYNDPYWPYMKIGLYSWDYPMSNIVQTERSLFIDEVSGGNALATYNDVRPDMDGCICPPRRRRGRLPIDEL